MIYSSAQTIWLGVWAAEHVAFQGWEPSPVYVTRLRVYIGMWMKTSFSRYWSRGPLILGHRPKLSRMSVRLAERGQPVFLGARSGNPVSRNLRAGSIHP
jgi:hypothetical protein